VPGTHTATVTATDASGLTATHTFSIEITPNPNGYKPLPTSAPPGWVPPPMSARPVAALPDAGLRLSPTGAIPVRIGCRALRCRGTVALAQGGRPVGRTSFSVRAGQTATARVRVSRSAAKASRRHGSVPVVVTVTVDGGDPASVRRTLKLRTRPGPLASRLPPAAPGSARAPWCS
jgi:hypothetical protein